MTTLAVFALATSLFLGSPSPAPAQTIYRWQDARGGLHFSNQLARSPAEAVAVELAPLGSIAGPAGSRRAVLRRGGAAHAPSACDPADPTRLAQAVASGTGVNAEVPDASLTLLVGGVPLSTSPSAAVRTLSTAWDPDEPQAHLSQSAVAYPAGSSCPTSPPLVRYSTTARRHGASRGLCDDYRQAFAQVGVAASRDAGIARSFHDMARAFIRVALEDSVATASGLRAELEEGMFTSDVMQLPPHMTIPLSPWIVAAHVAQTTSLADESDALVEQLTAALEEIDRAARASDCWD